MVVCICDGLHFFPKSVKTNYELRSGIRVKGYGRRICMGIPFQLLIAMIYYSPQSDIRVKTLARRNSPESSMINYERRDRLLGLFGDPVEKLWSFVFAMGFIFFPKCVSTNYELRSGIRVKPYGRPNMHGHSISTFNCHDILWASIGHPSQKFCPSEFTRVFHDKF